ncbi:MAG: MBL fold metallo-hydrolase [Anaerolineales bacterium]
MFLKYFFYPKLAHASYFVGCQETKEALIIDPARHLEPYLETARAQGMTIVAGAETHIHADYASGMGELATRTGAKLYLSGTGGADWQYTYARAFSHQLLNDGDTFSLGNLRFRTRAVPGHTPEHIVFELTDLKTTDEPMGIFTGDFVFVGDVGRPDLLEKAAGISGTMEMGARQLFRSLNEFRTLPDYLQIWPGHGAGSACGKALGAVPSSTLGYEKRFNWAFREKEENNFVTELLSAQPEPPRYFAVMKQVNKMGLPILSELPQPAQLSRNELPLLLKSEALIVDIRPRKIFAPAHIPGTINIPFTNSFPNWAGWLIPYDRPFYLIADPPQISEAIYDLRYIALDNLAGWFDFSEIAAYATQSYPAFPITEMVSAIERGDVTVVDVRAKTEWDEGHLPKALHLMLGYLPDRWQTLPRGKPVAFQCASGHRSAIASSFLQAKGWKVMNLDGGMNAWKEAGLPVVNSSC